MMALGYELVTHFLDCSEGELLGLSTPTRGARRFARTLDLLLLGLFLLSFCATVFPYVALYGIVASSRRKKLS
jgi:hypothetical protein